VLKLKRLESLSSFALNVNLCRYTLVRLVIRSDLCARRSLLRRAQRIHTLMLRSDTNTHETDQLLAELDLVRKRIAGGLLRTSTAATLNVLLVLRSSV
jgi:hypothetical protein